MGYHIKLYNFPQEIDIFFLPDAVAILNVINVLGNSHEVSDSWFCVWGILCLIGVSWEVKQCYSKELAVLISDIIILYDQKQLSIDYLRIVNQISC